MAQRRSSLATTDTAVRSARSTGRTAARSGARVRSRAAGEGQEVASKAAEEAQQVAFTAQAKGAQLASVASDQAVEIGATVAEQAARVRGTVVEEGRGVAEEARAKLEEQVRSESRKLADSLAKLGEEVHALADGRPEDAETIQPYVADAADAVYEAADRVYGLAATVDERGIGGVLEDLQSFARRRPGAFLVGAAVAGFGIGRAVRANSADDDEPGTVLASGNGSAATGALGDRAATTRSR